MALIGAYQVAFRIQLLASQAANSRVFEMGFGCGFNGAGAVGSANGNGIIPAYITVMYLALQKFQTSNFTNNLESSLDLYKSPVGTTADNNGVAFPNDDGGYGRLLPSSPVPSCLIGWCNSGNSVAGMTGGTFPAATSKIEQVGYLFQQTLPVAATIVTPRMVIDNRGSLLVTGANSGLTLFSGEMLVLKNRALFPLAGTASCYVTLIWEEHA